MREALPALILSSSVVYNYDYSSLTYSTNKKKKNTNYISETSYSFVQSSAYKIKKETPSHQSIEFMPTIQFFYKQVYIKNSS